MTIHLGCDPGGEGGFALLNGRHADAIVMPMAGSDVDGGAVTRWLEQAKSMRDQETIMWIEKVSAMPGQGVTSMFNFGKRYGTVIGICAGLRIPVQLVTPQAWKKVVLAGTDKSKDAAIEYVQMAYPGLSLLPTPRCRKPHDGMADAVCLAVYGSRQP